MFVYLQYLRGFAAVMVVYFHSVIQLKNFGIGAPILPLTGQSGVDLFFVLSGFLMWMTTTGKTVSPRTFLLKRLIRIAPLYWVLTIAAGCVALITPSLLANTVFEFPHFMASLAFSPVPNPAYLNSADRALLITPLLVLGWTLNYEIFFYLIFAAALFFPEHLRLMLVTLFFGVVAIAGFLLEDVGPALWFYSNPIIFEFAIGIVVAIFVRRLLLLDVRWASFVALVAAGLLVFPNNYEGLILGRAVAFGIPAAFFVYSLCCLEMRAAPVSCFFLRVIGDVSYSLYLTHVFVLAFCRLIFQYFYQTHSLLMELTFVVFCLVASLSVGILTYYMAERPVSEWLNKLRSRP